ncbi:MAG: UDP-N-acetylglucosamine 1-carboxyvinyltransferase [bacterium]|nr:UDP-N-acetylglucosamine 1-carboxyvinyltransferase [bacterium]
MECLRIIGGTPLKGEINVSGAKNAALPILAATLLSKEPVQLLNVPNLADIETLKSLLEGMGTKVKASPEAHALTLQTSTIESSVAPYELVKKMRASVLVLGPLLARVGHAEVSLPGGCAIGTRPVDLHLKGFEAMGAKITIDQGYINAKAPKNGLQGADIDLAFASVGATENLLMAACLAQGTTRIRNAAREPEIENLGNCLQMMGASIEGLGTDTLTIQGVQALHGGMHHILPDRIEAGTYAIAAAITGGDLLIKDFPEKLLTGFLPVLQGMGINIESRSDGLFVSSPPPSQLKGTDITTAPFPGFATDLQAQTMALMTLIQETSTISEKIFENRFMHVSELTRMGANIEIKGQTALVRPVDSLTGAPVMATDLRASVALVLAGLAAEGETILNRLYHLDRGYEDLEIKLRACGAHIERFEQSEVEAQEASREEAFLSVV